MSLLTDGFRTTVAFQNFNLFLATAREREVQPSGLDGGGPIDTVTMRNRDWRSTAPKSLISLSEGTLQVQYDPFAYVMITAAMLINQKVNFWFPDGSAISLYGWLDKFTPVSHKEGEFPLAEIKIHPSNINLNGLEEGPYYRASAAAAWVAMARPFAVYTIATFPAN